MHIEPLPETTFGAVVTEIALNDLDEQSWAILYNAFLEYGVLVFPGQHLSEEDQGAFARRFGGASERAADLARLEPACKFGLWTPNHKMPSVFVPPDTNTDTDTRVSSRHPTYHATDWPSSSHT